MASPTSFSLRPPPYISAVSIRRIPVPMPVRRAATSCARFAGSSPRYQVPCPRAGTVAPDARVMVFTSME